MEAPERHYKYAGVNLASDPALLLDSRSTAVPPGQGRAYEDFGNDLGPRTSSQKSSRSGFQPTTRRKPPIHDNSDEDELDFLSQASQQSADTVSRVNPCLKGAVQGKNGVITAEGQLMPYHPEHAPKPPLPKFKKTRQADGSQASLTSFKPSSSRPKADAMRKRSPSSKPHNVCGEVPSDNFYATSSKPAHPKDDVQKTPRPRPRPTFKNKNITKQKPASAPFRNLSPVSNNPFSGRDSSLDVSIPGPGSRLKAKAFPVISPPTSPAKARPKLQPKAFPTISPVGSPELKGKGRVVDNWDDGEDAFEPKASFSSSKSTARPFPLSSQFFHSSQTSPVSKRSSEDSDHDNSSSRKKRKADDPDKLPVSSLMLDEPSGINEQDLLFLDPTVDLSTLCPWCDEPLPQEPTSHLVSLIESVRKKSYREPRPTNPLGLKASVGAYVAVCKRHRFESHQVPLARAKGWPTRIDFTKVKVRVEALKEDLEALILNRYSDTPSDDWELDLDEDQPRPRSRSLFWQELVGDVKAKGTRTIASAKGQFANFEKLQPGYYGELGYLIIHQTIYQLFPPSSIDPNSVAPLTLQEFIQRILIPEAAVTLIMEDLGLNKTRAIKTLRESVEYGVAMFPDTLEGGEAADKMIKERASARRKELEIEEALEEKVLKKDKKKCSGSRRSYSVGSSSPVTAEKRSNQIPRPKRKGKIVEIEDDGVRTEYAEDIAKSKEAPKLVSKTRRRTKRDDSDTTDASTSCADSSLKWNRSTPSCTRGSRVDRSDSEVEIVSDSSKASKRAKTKTRGPSSESEGSMWDSSPSRQPERSLWRDSNEDPGTDGRFDVGETPRASNFQKHSSKGLRPLERARQRMQSANLHSEQATNPEQDFARVLGSED